MEITALNIYLIDVLGSIKTIFEFFSIFSIAISTIMLFVLLGQHGREPEEIKWAKSFKRLFLVSSCILIVSLFIPSEKTIAAMYILPKISNSQLVNKIPDYIQKYIESYLEEIKK